MARAERVSMCNDEVRDGMCGERRKRVLFMGAAKMFDRTIYNWPNDQELCGLQLAKTLMRKTSKAFER